MSEIAIEASGLTRYYGSKPIVRQIDFAVPRGSVTGLLGLNGTGKTTTIRMLVGLLAPTRGRSAVLGIDSQQLSPSDRARIGFAVEGHFLYNWMSVAACERFQSGTFPRWDSRLIHARRVGKRCVLTLVDFDSQTQDALQRIGGENLSRNPAAFDEAAIAYLSRSRGSESFFTPSQP